MVRQQHPALARGDNLFRKEQPRNLFLYLEGTVRDLSLSFRTIAKSPWFVTVAVLTLALGIGANTAIFSVVNGVLLHPLPYKDPEQIVTLWQTNTKEGVEKERVPQANFLDWKDQNRVFEEMALIEPYSRDFTGDGEPETIGAWLVSAGFFRILGVNALVGRTFLPEEYIAGKEQVIVFSYGLWQRRFGGDLNLVGKTITLDERPVTVVGIMPPEFEDIFQDNREAWAPKIFTERDKRRRTGGYMNAIARIKSGTTLAQAQGEMDEIATRIANDYPKTNEGVGITLVPLTEQMVGHVRPALLILLATVGFVLLIACANVANLFLAHGAERQSEFAIRAALGAHRFRIMRQMLTESIVLALLGGVGGILLAYWGIDLIVALSPRDFPRINEVKLDAVVLSFTFGISLLTALFFGLSPCILFSNPQVTESLKEGSRSVMGGLGQHRIRRILVVTEVALALVLLVGAGLLVRSFLELRRVELGFNPHKTFLMQVFVYGKKYPTDQERLQFFEETLDRLSRLPDVQATGAASFVPFARGQIDINAPFIIEGRPPPPEGEDPTVNVTVATVDYFRAMGIPLLRGRTFIDSDGQDSQPVTLINEAMARRHWGDEDPIGNFIAVRFGEPIPRRIVGVVGDVRHGGLNGAGLPEMFLPLRQHPFGSMTFVVRSVSAPESLIVQAKSQIWAVDKDRPFYSLAPMNELISNSLAERRLHLYLMGIFSLIALLLAALGIYGVMSLFSRQRTQEIGVRIALGAQRHNIMTLIVGQGIILTLMGLGLGLLGAIVLTRYLSSFLFGITPTDPLTFAGMSTVVLIVASLACYIPAWRATRAEPMDALRHE